MSTTPWSQKKESAPRPTTHQKIASLFIAYSENKEEKRNAREKIFTTKGTENTDEEAHHHASGETSQMIQKLKFRIKNLALSYKSLATCFADAGVQKDKREDARDEIFTAKTCNQTKPWMAKFSSE